MEARKRKREEADKVADDNGDDGDDDSVDDEKIYTFMDDKTWRSDRDDDE